MNPPEPVPTSSTETGTLRARVAWVAAGISGLIALAVLAGWWLDRPAWRSILPGAVEMKANTAAALLVASLALGAATRLKPSWLVLSRLLFAAVLLLGGATLAQYLLGIDLGIDEWLVRDTGAAFNAIKGRMSPYSAASFVAIGVAGLCLPFAPLWTRVAAGLVMAIGAISALGYLWNASELVTDRLLPPVAINTAVAFLLVGGGLLVLSTGAHWVARPRNRLERLLFGGLIPAMVCVIIGGGLSYTAGAHYTSAVERVAHTHEVLRTLREAQAALVEAEALLARAVLDERDGAGDVLARRFEQAHAAARRLVELTGDNPAQRAEAQRLADLAAARTADLRAVDDLLRTQGAAAARAALAAQPRQRTAEEVQDIVARMDAAEDRLLADRSRAATDQRLALLVFLLVTLAILGSVFALLLRGVRAEAGARAEAEAGLRRLNAELEQRVAERTRELEHQQAFLRRVIDLNRNLIFAKDRDGRFLLANQAFADVFGLKVEDVVGRTEQELPGAAQELEQFRDADRAVIDSGQPLVIDEESQTTAGGDTRWLTTVKQPMPSPDGSQTVMLGVATDITGRRNAEAQLRALAVDLERRVTARTLELHESNLELRQARLDSEAANRAKSAFLANMSHEIRTPMNAVIGLTHLMQRESGDPVQRDRLGKVHEAAQHLLEIINNILDMSKIEAGKLSLAEAEFPLDDMLARVTGMVGPRAREKGLELIVDTDDVPARLVGDETRLAQVLLNLLSNAVKFTLHGWIRLRGQVLAERADGRVQVRFEVQDTGPGIAPQEQGKLFHPFEQVDDSRSREHGGTGLGLALCRQLVGAMGGEIGVASAPGSGSRFHFTAWLGRGRTAAAAQPPVPLNGLRALLVDDLEESRAVIGDRLRSLGLAVDAFEDGPSVLRHLDPARHERPYDVVLIDWQMAPIDGLETCRQLRDLLGAAMPPALLVTAFDDDRLAERAAACGFDAVLLKPITGSALVDALARLLNRVREEQAAPPRPVPEPSGGCASGMPGSACCWRRTTR